MTVIVSVVILFSRFYAVVGGVVSLRDRVESVFGVGRVGASGRGTVSGSFLLCTWAGGSVLDEAERKGVPE